MASPRSRTPSPSRQDTRRSSPDVVNDPVESQVEQDLGFFAQEGGHSPAAALPINPAQRQFMGRQRRHSQDSTNSDAAFIDHRSQQHSLSTSAPRRSTITSRQTPSRALHQSVTRGNSGDHGQFSGLEDSPPTSPHLSAARARHGRHDESAVLDHRPSSVRSHGSGHGRERRHSGLNGDDEEPPVFTPSMSRRPSDAERALEDVCFPHLDMRGEDINQAARAGPPLPQGMRGMPGLLPNFPFPFDFAALEELADSERELVSPNLRPHEPLISFSPPQYPADKPLNGDGKPYRRMRKLSESAGTGRGNRYQRKLALFEGFGSNGALGPASEAAATPETQRRADQKTPLLGRTRSGRAVHADFGTSTARPHPRRANSTTGAGAAASEKERPYRFSFYSNGLPSTIHARSLGEIPAEGQSFQELFSGKKKEAENPNESAFSGLDGVESTTPSASAPNGVPPPKTNGMPLSRAPTVVRSDGDAEDNTWWLDVLCPTDAEMKAFSKCFGIHPLTTEDIQMEETREKIELFRNYYLVCFRSFDQDPYSPTYLEPLNMYVIVFREGTLSFHYRATPHPQNVRRRIKQLKDYISVSSDWISYALIDDITDAFGPLIQNIEYEVDSIDELVLILKETEQSDMLRRIGTCRKKVMGLLRLMGNKADVVKGLAKRCNENWSVAPKSDIGLYLSDIQDHLLTMTANLNHYEKILSRSHSNYLAQISIEMTEANNQINDVLSRLTALGTVLVPLNLVTGLWGMNVNVPGQFVDNLDWFFSIVAVLISFAVIGGFCTYYLMRR